MLSSEVPTSRSIYWRDMRGRSLFELPGRRARTRAVLLLGVLLSAGCSSGSSATEPEDGVPARLILTVPIDEKVRGLFLQNTVRLQVRIEDADRQPVVLSRQPAFHSRDPGVASVDPSGVILAEGAGSTFIRAELGASGRVLSDSVEIMVLRRPGH